MGLRVQFAVLLLWFWSRVVFPGFVGLGWASDFWSRALFSGSVGVFKALNSGSVRDLDSMLRGFTV